MLKRKPTQEEIASYFFGYINQVKGKDILKILKKNRKTTLKLLESIDDKKWNFAYAEGKWTIKEVLLHIIDCERVFTYRAMRISRRDETPLPGFDQDLFNNNSNAKNRSAKSLMKEYSTTRKATIDLFKNMTDEQLLRIGTASNGNWTPHAAAFVAAGHEVHHIKILNERYLNKNV